MSGDSPTVTPTSLNLVGLNLLDSLNEVDDLKSVVMIKNVPIPSPASTYAVPRTSSQGSSRTSEGDTTDCLNDKPFNRLTLAQGFVEWVDSPIHPRSHLPLRKADQKQEFVESHTCPHGSLAQFQANQNRQDNSPPSNKDSDPIPGHQPQQQPFMNFGAITTPAPPCTAPPVQHFAVHQSNVDIGMVQHVQQQEVTWFCIACESGVLMRCTPHFEAQWTGGILPKNEVFSVDQEITDPSGRIYLHLTDGRGWAFDDSALAPQNPSVVRMEFVPLSHPPIPCHTTDEIMTPNTQQPQPVTSSCVRCNYQMEVSAKFCCMCGKQQQQPPGVAAPGWAPCTH